MSEPASLYFPQLKFNEAEIYYNWCAKNASQEQLAELAKKDRYFLLTRVLHRVDAIHPWLYDRCKEVEANTDGYLDLWARDHYKSTIITFAGCIQEILQDPEITIGIFSHTRPISKSFLNQIKQEFETNQTLKDWYPDIFWDNPQKQAPKWSLDGGIVVKRTTNPATMTVEAHGVVDGQPVGMHYRLLVFDDLVTLHSVTNAEMIQKTTEAWELAQNLGSSRHPRAWHIGTRYSFADTYGQLIKRGALIPRLYPATDDGTPDGKPVFLSGQIWKKKKTDSSTFTIACQQLQNPIAGQEQEFKEEWIRTYEIRPHTLNVAILCDYAGSRKSTGSAKTAMVVIGIDAANNKYLLDGVCHKIGLADRWKYLKHFRNKWIKAPGVQIVKIGYERFGAQSDIEHFEEMMKRESCQFPIEEVNYPRDGTLDKDNRIRRLSPDFQNWRFFVPYTGDKTSTQADYEGQGEGYLLAKAIKQKNENNQIYDVVEWFIQNEFIFFPHTTQKDFLDAASRIYDLDINPPVVYDDNEVYPDIEAEY